MIPFNKLTRIDRDNRSFTQLPDGNIARRVSMESDIQIGAVEIKDGTTDNRATVNSEGQLHTVMRGKEDVGNSTTTSLIADATFTGERIDTLDYSAISVVVHSDVESAINGLKVQYSAHEDDESEWHDGEVYTILAGATKFFTPTLQARWIRIVYINGSSDQTDFHLHTVLRKTPIKWSSHNIDDPIKDEDDAELIKAVITGKKANGDYDNVSLTNGGNMKTSLEEYDDTFIDNPLPVQIMSGLIPENYDEIVLTYVTSGNGTGEIETVIYKKLSITVATLTLGYDVGNNLISVVRS